MWWQENLTLDRVWAPGDSLVIPVVGEHFVTKSQRATSLLIHPYNDSELGPPDIDRPWPLKLGSDTVLPLPPLAAPNQHLLVYAKISLWLPTEARTLCSKNMRS